MSQLHLLRPFSLWRHRGKPIRTIEAAAEYVEHIAGLGFDHFYTATARVPRRADELVGGSVYFVKGVTLFRMPFVSVDEDDPETAARFQGRVLVTMRPELIRVEPKHIGFLRGWRYCVDPPADLAPGDIGPPEGLRELGLA